MALLELKTEVPLDAVPALEDLLAEREEQRLMVLEDKPSGRAWLIGYFESQTEATQVCWSHGGPLDHGRAGGARNAG